MSRYRFTPKANADIRSIWSYIAFDNVEAADRVEEFMTPVRISQRLHYEVTLVKT
jgi:hypothetical protein